MRPNLKHIAVVGCFVVWNLFALPALAQASGSMDAVYERAGLDQKLGDKIPTDLVFTHENGEEVLLGSFFSSGKPIVLTLGYHSCPMLCNVLLDGFTDALGRMEWIPGDEFEIVTISIDPEENTEKALAKKEHYLQKLEQPEAGDGWHFLTGSEASIKALAEAIGFRYAWIEEAGQFVHPPILTILSEQGRISRYLQGITFEPREIRLALVEASDGKVGEPIDFITLYCLQYDPASNSYGVHAANLMRIGGLLTVIALGAMLYVFWRRETGTPAAS